MNESSQVALIVKNLITAWTSQITRVNELLDVVSEEGLMKETSPGRNSGIYLLGHLTAVHDGMLPLLGFGEKQYPELHKMFITLGDKSGQHYPSIPELKSYWKAVNTNLSNHFNKLTPEEWLSRHTAVSAEDFLKEPHRNKLNVLISRTNHLNYHYGQLIYLREKK